MKQEYMKPALQAVRIQHSQMLCGSPGTHDEPSDKPSYARQDGDWAEDDWEE